MVHTTVNIHPDFYKYFFAHYRDTLKVSNTELVCIIMKLLSLEMPQRTRPTGAVRYQDQHSEKWIIVHLYLTDEEYDHFVDMRNFFKMSVAHLISYGLSKYYSQILAQRWPDKNLFPEYSFGQMVVWGQQYFIICWGKGTEYSEKSSIP